jgi:hypothetical protein
MERNYMIFNVSELPNINFEEVLETSSESIRKSVDKQKTFVKWEGAVPSCLLSLTTKEGPYNTSEMVVIMNSPDWKRSLPIQ